MTLSRCPLAAAALMSLALLGATGASAQTGSAGQAQPMPPAASAAGSGAALSGEDRRFVMEAAAGGMAEVQLGELAQRQAASAEVKQFGALMVKDHGAANAELLRLAAAKGLQPPSQPGREQADLMTRLRKLDGAEFDREYSRAMLDDHRKDVAKFEQQARTAHDPEVKAFAERTLPTLKQHLAKAESLAGAGGTRR